MPARMRDVAREAGVSVSTVSRVISSDPRISEETRRRVMAVMERLDFHPHAAARSLATRRSRTLGVTLPQRAETYLANPFFPEVLRGIAAAASPPGYDVLLAIADEKEAVLHPMRLLKEGRADGVILLGTGTDDPLLERLVRSPYPFVLIGRPARHVGRPIPLVDNDNVALARTATEHLLMHGHRRVALINGPRQLTVCVDREQGYRQALEAAGITFNPAFIRYTDFSADAAREAALSLLTAAERPTAIFAVDDNLAAGALAAAGGLGLRVPHDLSIVGVNDTPMAARLNPPLTVMRIPIYELGFVAAQLLLDLVAGRTPAHLRIILPVELIERSSCAEPPRPTGIT